MKRLDAPIARTYAGATAAAGPLLYVRSTRRAKLGEWVRIEGAGQEGRRGQVIDVGDDITVGGATLVDADIFASNGVPGSCART